MGLATYNMNLAKKRIEKNKNPNEWNLIPSGAGVKSAALSATASAFDVTSGIMASGRSSFQVQEDRRMAGDSAGTSPIAKELASAFGKGEKFFSGAAENVRKSPGYKQEFNTIEKAGGGYDWGKLKNSDVLLGEMSTAFGSMAPILASAILTRGKSGVPGTLLKSAVPGALMEKGSAVQDYEQSFARQRGIQVDELSPDDRELINKASGAYGVIAGTLEAALPSKIVGEFGKKPTQALIRRIIVNAPISAVQGMVLEGSTEGLQQFSQNVIGRITDLTKDRPLSSGIIDSAIGGALSGGSVSYISGVADSGTAPIAPVTGETEKQEQSEPEQKAQETAAILNDIKAHAPQVMSVVETAVTTPVTEEQISTLTNEERQVLGNALVQIKETKPELTAIDATLTMLAESGVKIPVTSLSEETKIPVKNETKEAVFPADTDTQIIARNIYRTEYSAPSYGESDIKPPTAEESRMAKKVMESLGLRFDESGNGPGEGEGGDLYFKNPGVVDKKRAQSVFSSIVDEYASLNKADYSLEKTDDGDIILYHGTRKDSADNILSGGFEDHAYFSPVPDKSAGGIGGAMEYGDTILRSVVDPRYVTFNGLGEFVIDDISNAVKSTKLWKQSALPAGKKSSEKSSTTQIQEPTVNPAAPKETDWMKKTAKENESFSLFTEKMNGRYGFENTAGTNKALADNGYSDMYDFWNKVRTEKKPVEKVPAPKKKPVGKKPSVPKLPNTESQDFTNAIHDMLGHAAKNPSPIVVPESVKAEFIERNPDKTERRNMTMAQIQSEIETIWKKQAKASPKPAAKTEEKVKTLTYPKQKEKLTPSELKKANILFKKKDILSILKNSKELKDGSIFTMRDGMLRFEGKNESFSINPEKALGITGIKEGEQVKISKANLLDKEGGNAPAVFSRETRGKDGRFTGSTKGIAQDLEALNEAEIAEMIRKEVRYSKLANEIRKQINPILRANLEISLVEKIVDSVSDKDGTSYYTKGKYEHARGLVTVSTELGEKDFISTLIHEIRHHAFRHLTDENKQRVVDWYRGLSEVERVSYYKPEFGSEKNVSDKLGLFKSYEKAAKKRERDYGYPADFAMADETFNRKHDLETSDMANDSLSPVHKQLQRIVDAFFRLLIKLNNAIFKGKISSLRNRETMDLYRNIFEEAKGPFSTIKGYAEMVEENRRLKPTGAAPMLSADVVTEKGNLRAQEVFRSAWKKLYGVEAPEHLYSMLDEGFGVGKTVNTAFVTGKSVQRVKSQEQRMEAREKNALRVKELRADLRTMYKEKTATAQDIKGKVISYVKANIPKQYRGQYLVAVKNAKTPANLAKVIARIDEHRAKYERSILVQSINKVIENIEKIPVDLQRTIVDITSNIELKNHTERLLRRLRKTKAHLDKQANDFEMPRRVLNELGILKRTPLNEISSQKLIAINNRLQQYSLVGRNIMKDKAVREKNTLQETLASIEQSSVNLDKISPDDRLNTFAKHDLASPDDRRSFMYKAKESFPMDSDRFMRLQLSLLGMDRIFNKLDQRADYTGANYRTFKEPIDAQWNVWQSAEDRILRSFYQMVNELKLTAKNSERIAIHAYMQQRGGKKKLIEDRKFTEEQLDAIQLTEKEMLAYTFMRKHLDDMHEKLAEKMEKDNNVMLGHQENYFPMLQDYGVAKPLLEELQDMNRMRSVPFGSIKERKENAHQALKLDAFQVFDSYIGKATYFVAMDKTIRDLSTIASSEKYRGSVGDNAQKVVLGWLDVLARKGGAVQNEARWEEKLNHLNSNLSIAILGLRLTTMMKQPLAILDGAAEIGAYAFRGTRLIIDEDWRGFMRENSSEMRNRSGGDIAFERVIHNEVIPRIQDKAMYPIKFLDFYTAGAVWTGAYQKKIDELGLPVDLKNPNKEALKYANLVVRKTQASGNFKDLPPAVVNEYRTVSKLFFKFGTFVLNRWSYIKEDLPDKMKNDKKLAAQQLVFLSLSIAAEASITSLYYGLMHDDDDEDSKTEKTVRAMISSLVQTVPFIGQVFSSLNYGTTPMPLIEVINKFFDSIAQVTSAKKLETKEKHALRALSYAVGTIYGLPTAQAQQLLEKWLFGKPGEKHL